jgi:hypothetical protein
VPSTSGMMVEDEEVPTVVFRRKDVADDDRAGPSKRGKLVEGGIRVGTIALPSLSSSTSAMVVTLSERNFRN